MDKPVTQPPVFMVKTLGAFRLGDSGAPVAPRGRKARALIALLALSGRPLVRERIVDLLWSDRGAEQARSSLRQTLFEIRHADPRLESLVEDGSDGLALNEAVARSDLTAIRAASDKDDWPCLEALLSASGGELLEDLNGVDPEFDDWLRSVRAVEPGRSLAVAIASGKRALADGQIEWAKSLAAEVLRLDPSSEPATRLAMRAAEAAGDRAEVHRHYRRLGQHLRSDYDAAPSRDTQDLLVALAKNGIQSASEERDKPADPNSRFWSRNRRWSAAMVTAGLAGAVSLALYPTTLRPPSDAPPLLAVVPFEAAPGQDKALAEGLWDDTRTTLSRSGVVRVLGRTTSEAYAREELTPADYRKKLDVDYLLDGGVRREGDRVRVTVSLLRTKDGVAVWEHAFDGRLGDPIALQGAIANAIEGRIRGRLATGGGALASQIRTTPEVYELYSQAKVLVRSRIGSKAQQAEALLDRAIKLDPNFAPALSLSGSALYFGSFAVEGDPEWRAEAKAKTDRAVELAPRLGQAYAVSALLDGLNSRASEQKLVKATTLDPGDAEAWLWLGNVRLQLADRPGGRAAYERAVDVDPYLTPAVANLADLLLATGDGRGFDRLYSKLRRADSSGMLAAALRSQREFLKGNLAESTKEVLRFANNPEAPDYLRAQLAGNLIALGYWDENGRLLGLERDKIDVMAGRSFPDLGRLKRDFFLDSASMTVIARTGFLKGQERALVAAYHRAFPSSADYVRTLSQVGEPELSGPNLAVALQRTGFGSEAATILKVAEAHARQPMDLVSPDNASLVWLARVRAAQGHSDEAVDLLNRAVVRGWVPDGIFIPSDLGRDPALRMADGPRFQALRSRVLTHLDQERRALGRLTL